MGAGVHLNSLASRTSMRTMAYGGRCTTASLHPEPMLRNTPYLARGARTWGLMKLLLSTLGFCRGCGT